MYEYLGTAMMVLVIFIVYEMYLKPLRIMKHYVKSFQAKGFKVYMMPIRPFGVPLFEQVNIGTAKGDALGFAKKQLVDYDIVISNSFNRVLFILTNPDLIKDYVNAESNQCLIKLKQFSGIMDRGLGKGVFLSEGKAWKKKRRIINQVFTYQFILYLRSRISAIISNSFDAFELKSKRKEGKIYTINLKQLCEEIFGNVMIQCFLGGDCSCQEINGVKAGTFFCDFQQKVTNQSMKPSSLILGRKLVDLGFRKQDREILQLEKIFKKWGIQFVKKRVNQQEKIIIQNRQKEEIKSDNIVRRFIKHKMQAKKQGSSQYYDDEQLYEEFKTFFVSGTDTTNKFVQMLVYYLGKYPQVQQKCREQISMHCKGQQCCIEDIKKLKYLQAVQKQAIRVFGPANFSIFKETAKKHYLGGVAIREGIILQHFSLSTHYSPKYYKNPHEFRPQRWLSGELDNLHPFALYGFHGGARGCLGKQLAWLQAKIFIIKFLKRYCGIKVPSEPIRMELKFIYSPQQMQIEVKKN